MARQKRVRPSAEVIDFPGVRITRPKPPPINPRHQAASDLIIARDAFAKVVAEQKITLPLTHTLALDVAIDRAVDALVYEK